MLVSRASALIRRSDTIGTRATRALGYSFGYKCAVQDADSSISVAHGVSVEAKRDGGRLVASQLRRRRDINAVSLERGDDGVPRRMGTDGWQAKTFQRRQQNRVPDFLHRPTRSAQPRVDCVAGNLLWIFVGVGQ